MTHPLEGITEKLKRADENIRNLDGEIAAFFKEGLYPVLPHDDEEAFQKALHYHASRIIPTRFSVLAGEIVHHQRSCLDHLVWLLSSEVKRRKDPQGIEYPILTHLPKKDELGRYDRKVEGMTPRAKAIVKRFENPSGFHPPDSPLAILHDFDRIDKHQEVRVVMVAYNLRIGPDLIRAYISHKKAESPETLFEFDRAMKVDRKVIPQIAFKDIGTLQKQSVCDLLRFLGSVVRDIVLAFEPEFK